MYQFPFFFSLRKNILRFKIQELFRNLSLTVAICAEILTFLLWLIRYTFVFNRKMGLKKTEFKIQTHQKKEF